MTDTINVLIGDLVRKSRDTHTVLDVQAAAQTLQTSYPNYSMAELADMVLQQAIRSGANAKW